MAQNQKPPPPPSFYSDPKYLAEALANFEKEHAGDSALNIAENYSRQGKFDETFAWLHRAHEEGQSIQFIRISAFFHRLEKDSRWEELLLKLGLADDQMSGIEL